MKLLSSHVKTTLKTATSLSSCPSFSSSLAMASYNFLQESRSSWHWNCLPEGLTFWKGRSTFLKIQSGQNSSTSSWKNMNEKPHILIIAWRCSFRAKVWSWQLFLFIMMQMFAQLNSSIYYLPCLQNHSNAFRACNYGMMRKFSDLSI